jgi:dipeptidyl aminopeptidase/acylaminoacyl peptidase
VESNTTTPFHNLNDYIAIPRVTSLRLSPDGTWLAASVQTLSADRKKYITSMWRIDAGGGDAGGGKARRLTRSAEGEACPRFLPDGSLLFISKRPVQEPAGPVGPEGPSGSEGKGDSEAKPVLWSLPAGGGEARVVAMLPGGVTGVETAADRDAIVVASPVLPAAGTSDPVAGDPVAGDPVAGDSVAEDERLRAERKDAGITAILHETVPVRFWDHDLGPADPRLFAVPVLPEIPATEEEGQQDQAKAKDLTPDAGRALLEQAFTVSPDGTAAAAGWWRWIDGVQSHAELVRVDLASGKRTVLLADPEFDYADPAFSPDGRQLACVRSSRSTREAPNDCTLVLIDEAGEETDLVPDLDRWPAGPVWEPAGRCVYFTADDGGRHPVFRVDVKTKHVTRVTADDGYYSDLNVARDGSAVYALRAAVDEPPTPVRVDLATGELARLDAPGQRPGLPGRLTEIETTADDGHPVRGWLVLPEGAGPDSKAPLLLWVHGGPMMSWNSWSWRWNPWLMAARGYAVLLPDPALSTGYGQDFVKRGYHAWGMRPFGDLMAATDAAVKRDDIDATRTGMMGGSYGGYMANWIAGHTDRFDAIVSHASLWVLDQMFGTTDGPMFWRPQFGDPMTSPEMYEENSPHRHIENIKTPMLVTHGNGDYRVPLGEALRLWWDLRRHQVPAKFLYFPDENHWILKPGNARAWYETVFAFLAEHVLGEPWRRPDLL